MYKVKETFEYLVNDPNNFCSIHDALEMDTSMPCLCWEGSNKTVPHGTLYVKIVK